MPPQVSMQISGMRNAAIHPNTTALIATAMSELEPEAHAAIEAELGKPLLACG